MTRKKYDFDTNNLVNADPIDKNIVAERIYAELGVRFQIDWSGVDAIPYIEMDNIPNGIQESKVKNAIQKHHPRENGAPALPDG